jgi:subtilisin family serine protease
MLAFSVLATPITVLATESYRPTRVLPYAEPVTATGSDSVVVVYADQLPDADAATDDARAASADAVRDVLPRLEASVVDDVGAADVVSDAIDVVQPVEGVSADELADELRRDPQVAYAFPDVGLQTLDLPNDYAMRTRDALSDYLYQSSIPNWGSGYSGQKYSLAWQYQATGIEDVWDSADLTHQVGVAVIDTGVNVRHPDLEGRLGNGKYYAKSTNYVSPTGSNIIDPDGHGTMVALTIAATANNSVGSAGAAGAAPVKIIPYGVDPRPSVAGADDGLSVAYVLAAIEDAADNSAVQVINISLGVSYYSVLYEGLPLDTYQELVAILNTYCSYAAAKGKLIVAAAGNDGGRYACYPASGSSALSVAALAYNYSSSAPGLFRATFSTYNAGVDISAPGKSIPMQSTMAADGSRWSYTAPAITGNSDMILEDGTSFASPIVAGIAACLLSAHPELSPARLRSILTGTTQAIGGAGGGVRTDQYGYGVVRADRALTDLMTSQEEPAPDYTLTVKFVDAATGAALPGVASRTVQLKAYETYTGFADLQLSYRSFSYWTDSATGEQSTKTTYTMPKANSTLTVAYADTHRKMSAVTASALSSYTYTGSARSPRPVLKYGSTTLVAGRDYRLSYANNVAIGKATVTVTGMGTYTGTKTLTFQILPKKTAIKKLSRGKRKLTVKWAAVSGKVSKYQVRYKRSGTSWKTKTVSATKRSLTIRSLTAKKTYTVQVRSYKTVKGVKYYAAWSNAKSIKTK